MTDPHIEALRARLLERSARGIEKYGATLARTDLSDLEWHYHHLDELLDAAGYVMRKISDMEAMRAADADWIPEVGEEYFERDPDGRVHRGIRKACLPSDFDHAKRGGYRYFPVKTNPEN